MDVRLTPQQDAFVKLQVAEGRYPSESEVIGEGLRLLETELGWKADAPRKIATGMDELQAGQVVDGEQAVEEVLTYIRQRRQRSKGA